jgi:PAS domain S-box-containing protein
MIDSTGETVEALREQRDSLRATLSSMGDAVITTDTNGGVAFLNPAAAQSLTGWTQEEGVGKPLDIVFKLFNEETRRALENSATRALREGGVVGSSNHTLLNARRQRIAAPRLAVLRPVDDADLTDQQLAIVRCEEQSVVTSAFPVSRAGMSARLRRRAPNFVVHTFHSLAHREMSQADSRYQSCGIDALCPWDLIRRALDSQAYRAFENFEQLARYAEATGEGKASSLVKLVNTHRGDTPRIVDEIQDNAVDSPRPPDCDVIFTSAQRARGLQGERVRIADDFCTRSEAEAALQSGAEPDVQEVNLLYIAITRARKALVLNPDSEARLAGERFARQ